MTELKTKVKDESPIKKTIEISIPVERVKDAIEREYKLIGKNAKLKGFRKGKVPRHILEKYYSEDAEKGTIEALVRETYPEALEKEMLIPISAPYVQPGPFDKNAGFDYSATFEIRPVVEVKEYHDLNLERPEASVTKEEVDQQLETVRQHMAQLEPLPDDVKAENDMVLLVDFKGTVEGKPFKGSEAKDFMVELGAKSLLPEFEEALISMGKGDEKDFDIDYPADYFNNELAGKKGKFHIKLKDLKKKVVPELTDEFAKDLGNFSTLNDVKKDIEKRILEAKERDIKRLLSTQVFEQLVEKHPFEVPESMINSELKAMFESFVRHLSMQGKKFEDSGITIDQFIERHKKDAENRVRAFLIVDAIAEIEKIAVSEEEIENRLKLIAEQTGQPLPKVRGQYEKENLLNGLRFQLIHEKTLDLIVDKAKIKTKNPKKTK